MKKGVLPNIIFFAFLSTVIAVGGAVLGDAGTKSIVVGISTATITWFATVGRSLIAAPHEPTVRVPASHLMRLAGLAGQDSNPDRPVWYPTPLTLASFATVIVGVLAWQYWAVSPEIVAGPAGAVIGWFAGSASDLVTPPPEQSVEVPVSTLKAFAERGSASS